MKGMVQVDGSSSRGDALHVRGISVHRSSSDNNDRFKSNDGRGRSKGPKKHSVSTAIRNLTTLKNVGNCRIWRRGKIILMVRLVLLLLPIILNQIAWLSLPVVLLVMMNGYLIPHVHFICELTEIGLVHMSLCRMEILCV